MKPEKRLARSVWIFLMRSHGTLGLESQKTTLTRGTRQIVKSSDVQDMLLCQQASAEVEKDRQWRRLMAWRGSLDLAATVRERLISARPPSKPRHNALKKPFPYSLSIVCHPAWQPTASHWTLSKSLGDESGTPPDKNARLCRHHTLSGHQTPPAARRSGPHRSV